LRHEEEIMAAATASTVPPPTTPSIAGGLLALAQRAEKAGAADSASALLDEARLGIERLSKMSHDELRRVIAERVQMLDTGLREREARRAAIEEATVAQRLLEARRRRARQIRRKVNIGSSIVAAMFTGVIVAVLF
jgi:hypothetical protein